MWFNRSVLVNLVIFVSLSRAYKYKTVMEDDEIFSKCESKQGNELDIHGLFDLSELNITPDFDKMSVSGNVTLLWDIQPMDRVQVDLQLLKFDRGSWQPTIYSMKMLNFCPIMYDKNQYWYISWLTYITNLEEIKDKCLNVPGTKFMHQPFDLEFVIDSHIFNFAGHYKAEAIVKAFDKMNRMRPTYICYTIKVELVRI